MVTLRHFEKGRHSTENVDASTPRRTVDEVRIAGIRLIFDNF